MNEGLQKLQVPEFKDKLFYHYYYWEFYSLELFTWTHNIAFETFALNLGCLFELRCMMSSTAAASNRPVVLLTLLNKPRLDKKERSFTTFPITKWSFKHSMVLVLMGVLMKSQEYSLRGGKPVCEKSLSVAMVERWGSLKDFLAQMSGWLWVFQWDVHLPNIVAKMMTVHFPSHLFSFQDPSSRT